MAAKVIDLELNHIEKNGDLLELTMYLDGLIIWKMSQITGECYTGHPVQELLNVLEADYNIVDVISTVDRKINYWQFAANHWVVYNMVAMLIEDLVEGDRIFNVRVT